ncbi:magnesium/cobalt efflux protein [Psychrobacter sp. YP14]|jgi:magnesium and cobalt transporter|uniref:Magnesium and cobalt efflux protein CorC n=2 Tax=Psychrobacter TaxID=497 RepID=A0A844M246_9GAMM|nr:MULTISPECIES: CBS domain-containing protein [Psychrobacter]AWT49947.1 magnesium/cobalt efflux protein [Psychrobacter sp. YP14]MUG32750.1 CBS domain-containing protein [Psychrobacter sanguinis]
MSDDNSGTTSWSMRGLKRWLHTAPETRDELIKLVQNSRQFLEADTVDMLEGVLDLPATQVREIMTPRPQVEGVREHDTLGDIMDMIMETSHSRYPVFDSQDDDAVIGILLAKDLIPLLVNMIRQDEDADTSFRLKSLIRQPLYISETARSDTLLRSLQRTQVHMAVVVDEFGNMVGVVTMEDLLEEIVGDIVDEHDDFEEDSDINNIIPHPEKPNTWIVQASTLIEDCNEELNANFDDTDVDTMGGLVMQELGYVGDLEGESVTTQGWHISIIDVEGRFIKLLELTPVAEDLYNED